LSYKFIRQQKEAFPVTILCKVMEVSRSCFYYYLKHCNTHNKDPYEAHLKDRIKTIFDQSKATYGSRRIAKKLQSEGYGIGRYQARSFMQKLGLPVKKTKRYKITTNSRHSYPVASNLLDQQFEVDAPNSVWTADITYIWTLEGWLYLAAVMDLSNRQIVGWAMNKRMKAQLVIDALAMAYWRRKPSPGLMHHSDRGSQYACDTYQKQLKQYHMITSMSRKGNCWDNAPTERFFRSLKSERIVFCRFASRNAAKAEVLDYITFYNAYRLHSTLGYMSPMDYEKSNILNAA
jgi:putative transposase